MAAVTDVPETRYAKTGDGVHIAYQVVGEGPLDVVFIPLGASHVEQAWELPSFARVFRRLASFSRLIRFDVRGSGLSDPLSLAELPSLEQQAADMLVVLDAAGSERAAVVANSNGGLLAVFFAATYPTRVSALVLDGCSARWARAPDYPWGLPKEFVDHVTAPGSEDIRAEGRLGPLRRIAPTAGRDPEFAAQWERYSRSVNSPASARAFAELFLFADVRPALSAVQAPTLVLYRHGDRFAGKPHAAYLAEQIRGATLVEVPGDDNLIFAGDSDADLDEIEEFLTGTRHAVVTDRVLATVLFTDIVGSTERAAQLGDRAWRGLLDAHDGVVRRQLERFRGREVKSVGDGFVATFDGPGRAIQCACAIRDAVKALEIEVRTGLHTGEIEMRGDDVAGMAVHIGARVAALAESGEVLVSSAIPPLVVGSGIEFVDRGEHELKGVPGTWRLYRAVS
jgi:class 3 adenylate cyclase/alpha-beta hydrolase superfamily lysophospholipase